MEKTQFQIINEGNDITGAIESQESDKISIKPRTMADRTFLLHCRLKTLLLQTIVNKYK